MRYVLATLVLFIVVLVIAVLLWSIVNLQELARAALSIDENGLYDEALASMVCFTLAGLIRGLWIKVKDSTSLWVIFTHGGIALAWSFGAALTLIGFAQTLAYGDFPFWILTGAGQAFLFGTVLLLTEQEIRGRRPKPSSIRPIPA